LNSRISGMLGAKSLLKKKKEKKEPKPHVEPKMRVITVE